MDTQKTYAFARDTDLTKVHLWCEKRTREDGSEYYWVINGHWSFSHPSETTVLMWEGTIPKGTFRELRTGDYNGAIARINNEVAEGRGA